MTTWQNALMVFISVCASFATVCVAGGWLIKIYKGLKKPSDDTKERFKNTDEKLDNDNKRIQRLEDDIDYISKALSVLMRSNLAMLGHMASNNNTGEMAKVQDEIQEFLINN